MNIGLHLIINYSVLLGSPLQFYVDYVNSGHVTAYGPGLIHGMVNKPAVFTVNTKDAGEGIYAQLFIRFYNQLSF